MIKILICGSLTHNWVFFGEYYNETKITGHEERNTRYGGYKMAGRAFARPAFYRLTAVRRGANGDPAALPTVNTPIILYTVERQISRKLLKVNLLC